MNKSKVCALVSGFFLFASSIMLVVIGILYNNYNTGNLFYYLNSLDLFIGASFASLAIGSVICALANKKHYFVLIPTVLSLVFAIGSIFNSFYINLWSILLAICLFLVVLISIFAALPQLEKAFKVIRFFVILPALIFTAYSVVNVIYDIQYYISHDDFYYLNNFEAGFYLDNIMSIVIAAFSVIGFILFSIWLASPAIPVQAKKKINPQAANAPMPHPNAGYNQNFNQNANQGFNPNFNQNANQGFTPNQMPMQQQAQAPFEPQVEPQVEPVKQMRHLSESEIMDLNNFTVLFEAGKISELEYEANKNYLLFDKKD